MDYLSLMDQAELRPESNYNPIRSMDFLNLGKNTSLVSSNVDIKHIGPSKKSKQFNLYKFLK